LGRGLCWALFLSISLAVGGAAFAQITAPAPEGATGGDLRSGRVDTTPLMMRREYDESGAPISPPQTVEGTVVSIDLQAHVLTVRTKRDGDVKVGVPVDLVPSRNGQDSTIDAIHPGDRVYATVETINGVRAIRLVSDPPVNPLINYVGIPLLLLIALVIWWTGRQRGDVVAERKAPAKPAGKP
jgi:hypothetical protein